MAMLSVDQINVILEKNLMLTVLALFVLITKDLPQMVETVRPPDAMQVILLNLMVNVDNALVVK
jgi:hypothetical protein